MGESLISVIIPVKNDFEVLQRLLAQLGTHDGLEVIVVDGGSAQSEIDQLQSRPEIQLLRTNSPRSNQLIQGAEAAKGEILFFLHADSLLGEGWDAEIRRVLALPKVVAGAFSFAVDQPGLRFKLLELGVKLRCFVKSLPYGDQGLFITQKAYSASGGFKPMALMEDYEFVERLKTEGKIAVSPLGLVTSARRFVRLGMMKSIWVNFQVVKRYNKGAALEELRQYYQKMK